MHKLIVLKMQLKFMDLGSSSMMLWPCFGIDGFGFNSFDNELE
jgi:hypothetical protein